MSLSVTSRDPEVQSGSLVWYEGGERLLIKVGTPAWYRWLETSTRFSFASDHGRFTAYRERREGGRWYGRTNGRRGGKLRRAYLGKTEQLTLERLNEVAAALAMSGTRDDPHPLLSDRMVGTSTVSAQETVHGSSQSRQGDPLLATKISPPLARPELVSRPRLLARLLKGLQGKLTLISAPAGFGKTTLLGQWSLHVGCPVAWVSLDAADNDPTRFWTYVISALQTLYPSLGGTTLTLLRSPQRSRMQHFLTVLANEVAALPDDLVLILDDYQVIEDQAIHDGTSFLLDHLPLQLHVVIASRTAPPLPLARLRGRDQLTELESADLSFTSEETAAFLNQVMKLDLAAEDVAALGKRTEGWIVGLQMAALSMKGCTDTHGFVETFAGSYRYVADYLVEEVLRCQPEHIQSFLLQTSILDGLSGPLCEAVTGLGKGEGQTMLEILERGNLFTLALDNERRWYRYHRLFAECLQTRLQQVKPSRVSELHRRAAVWHADNGMASDAVGHAFAAGDLELAASLVERHGALMLKRGEVATLLGWLAALPNDVVQARPLLCIWHAHVLVDTGQLEAAEARLADAELHLGMEPGITPDVGGSTEKQADIQRILNHMLAIRTAIAHHWRDVELALALSRQALERSFGEEEYLRAEILHDLGLAYRWTGDLTRGSELLAEANVIGQASANVLVAVMALTQLSGLQSARGRLREVNKTCEQMLPLVLRHEGQVFPAAGRPFLVKALLHYEWNDLETATRYAGQGIERSQQGGMVDLLLGHSVTARLKQALGDIDGALDSVWQAEHLARANNLIQELPRIAVYRVRLWLRQGNLDAAVRWAETSGLGIEDEISYPREGSHMTLARVLTAQGRSLEAVRLLDRLLDAADAAGRAGGVLKILALRALALQAAGDSDGALRALVRGLSLAEPEGYVRTFVDVGNAMAALLSTLLQNWQQNCFSTVSPEYVRTLLAAFNSGSTLPAHLGPHHASQPALVLLSSRELEVLRLVALGRRPPEIARELTVAISTIKTHIKSIYGKLDAHSGVEAVAKARDLKLL
ncbi:MAG: helix-turn-helix transcriptional regulator [Chloroflexota bacterium]|nr:MAG: helix-turn-helix transcriptional regulator [Chloroflexota bacterium]